MRGLGAGRCLQWSKRIASHTEAMSRVAPSRAPTADSALKWRPAIPCRLVRVSTRHMRRGAGPCYPDRVTRLAIRRCSAGSRSTRAPAALLHYMSRTCRGDVGQPPVTRPVSESAAKAAARPEGRTAALALRPSMSPPGRAHDRLRVATWNLNSLRARPAAVSDSSTGCIRMSSVSRRQRQRSFRKSLRRCSSAVGTVLHTSERGSTTGSPSCPATQCEMSCRRAASTMRTSTANPAWSRASSARRCRSGWCRSMCATVGRSTTGTTTTSSLF